MFAWCRSACGRTQFPVVPVPDVEGARKEPQQPPPPDEEHKEAWGGEEDAGGGDGCCCDRCCGHDLCKCCGARSCRCCRCKTLRACCGCCCGYTFGVLLSIGVLYCLFLLGLAFAIIGVDLGGGPCAIEDSAIDDIQGGLVLGTTSNVIGPSWDLSIFDLTGYWWIYWDNPNDALYNSWRLEVAGGFAGAHITDGGDPATGYFPMTMRVPGGSPHHWGYSNSWFAIFCMIGHAYNWPFTTELTWVWKNSTFADIVAIDSFIKISEDQWLRPNEGFQYNYKLTRVMYANGTRHPEWWPKFADFMSGYELRMWGVDSQCRRKCEISLAVLGVPKPLRCPVCYRGCP